MKKTTIFTIFALFFIFSVFEKGHAQTVETLQGEFESLSKQANLEIEAFKIEKDKVFRDFREQVNAEFAALLGKSWEGFSASPTIPPPPSLEPVKPAAVEREKKQTADLITVGKITPPQRPEQRPQPIAPIVVATNEVVKPTFSFLFYNTECKVNLDNSHRFSLQDV
jgi:hypothetical protein